MPHHFEKRPPTVKQYTEAYERWTEQLQENAKRIEDSADARIYLTKNAATAPLQELLIRAVDCIYDLTGDSQFRDQVRKTIEKRGCNHADSV